MTRFTKRLLLGALTAAVFAAQADSARACAMCYGRSDSPLAGAMNWGIFSLLAVVVCVLSTLASFFVFIAKKAAANPPPSAPADAQPPTNQV